MAVEEVVVEHHSDADAAVGDVGHRAPAFVHAQSAVVAGDAAPKVLAERGGRQVEQALVARLLVEADEHQGRTR